MMEEITTSKTEYQQHLQLRQGDIMTMAKADDNFNQISLKSRENSPEARSQSTCEPLIIHKKTTNAGICCLCEANVEARCFCGIDLILSIIILVVTAVDLAKLTRVLNLNLEEDNKFPYSSGTPMDGSTNHTMMGQYPWKSYEVRHGKILCNSIRTLAAGFRLLGSVCLLLGIFKRRGSFCSVWFYNTLTFLLIELILQAYMAINYCTDDSFWFNFFLGLSFLISYQTYVTCVVANFVYTSTNSDFPIGLAPQRSRDRSLEEVGAALEETRIL